jgi:thioredoxin-like negative regulator of GroEL
MNWRIKLIQITNLQQLISNINTNKSLVVYFSGENCSVCKVLKPKIEKVVIDNFPKMEIYEVKTDNCLELSAQFLIFSIPTVLVYFDKKEFKRYGRNMSIPLFVEELKRPYNLN